MPVFRTLVAPCGVSLSLTMITTHSVHSYSVMETMEHDVKGYEDR